MLGVHRRVRADERDAALAFEQQRLADRARERPAVHRCDDLECVHHAERRARVTPIGGPVVVAVQRERMHGRSVRDGAGARDADRFEVAHHPLLVTRLLVHVLVEVVADLPVRVGNAAGRRAADRVEVPDHVVQLEQQRPVALDGHAAGDRVEHDAVGFELAACLVGAHHEVGEERHHR